VEKVAELALDLDLEKRLHQDRPDARS